MSLYFSSLCVLTFSPLLLLLNDLLAQSSFYPPTGVDYFAYDDVFKCLFWAPFSLGVLATLESIANPNPTHLQRIAFTVLSGMYVYGFGVNHSHNAVGNYYERSGGVTPPAVHYFDEYIGHYIIVLVYGLVQVYWSLSSKPRDGGGLGVVALGLFGGYFSALLVLESQSAQVLLPIDVLLVLNPPKDRELGLYVRVNAGVHLLFYLCWYSRWGRFVEPTELAGLGWDKMDAATFGLRFSGPEL
mmetsp:Transcript_10575/g.21429  ORF Transcript_10575/g.21429 Transcript_10575/m.21429 type:complete len:243 (+) Transcript_10575:166-894(+)